MTVDFIIKRATIYTFVDMIVKVNYDMKGTSTCTRVRVQSRRAKNFFIFIRPYVHVYSCTRLVHVHYDTCTVRKYVVRRYIFDMICIIQIGLRESYVYTYCTVRITTRMYFMISYEYFMYVAQQYNTYLRTFVLT